jgi:hypothetical protein
MKRLIVAPKVNWLASACAAAALVIMTFAGPSLLMGEAGGQDGDSSTKATSHEKEPSAKKERDAAETQATTSDKKGDKKSRKQEAAGREAEGRQLAVKLGLAIAPSPAGSPLVVAVRPDSLAALAGLRAGDYIVSVGEQEVKSPEQLQKIMRRQSPGGKLTITAWRAGEELEMVAHVPEKEETAATKKDVQTKPRLAKRLPQEDEPASEQPLGSEQADDQDPLVGKAWLGLMIQPSPRPGVDIARIYLGSPAMKAGLRPGDRIISVDGQPVNSAEEVAQQTGKLEPGTEVELVINRRGRLYRLSLEAANLRDFHARLFGKDFRTTLDDFHALIDPDFDGIPDRILTMRPPSLPSDAAPSRDDADEESDADQTPDQELPEEASRSNRTQPEKSDEDAQPSLKKLLRATVRALQAVEEELDRRSPP